MKWANVGMKNDASRLAGPKVAKSLRFVKTAVKWSTANRAMPVPLLKPLSLWCFVMAAKQTNMGTLRLPCWDRFIKNSKWLIWFKNAFHMCVWVTQSCLTLSVPMDCSPPGSYVHGILQARIVEWVAISFSRGSSRPRDWIWVSCTAGRSFTVWATSF